MVAHGRRLPLTLCLLVLLNLTVSGQEPLDQGDLEEMEETLRTLDEAGVSPTREDLARFLRDQEAENPVPSPGEGPSFFSGNMSYRAGHYQDEGLDHYGKISLELPWLRLRGRMRQYRTGMRETVGAAELKYGPGELRAGILGLSHGHGLLVGAPGRGSSLAADAGFRPSGERLVTWLGSDDARAVAGLGGAVRFGSLSLRFIQEEPRDVGSGSGARQTVVQVGFTEESWRLSLAGQSSAGVGGASIAAGMAKGSFSGSLEAMGQVVAPGIPPAGSGVLQVKWSPVRGSGVEAVFGFADLPVKPRLGSRPAVLPGWEGRGLAFRGFTRTGAGLVLRALIHLGRHLDRVGIRARKTRILVDLQGATKPLPPVEISLRFRRDTKQVWEWSERYPWQAPGLVAAGHRTIVSGQIAYEKNQDRARLLVRSYALESATGHGRRSMAGLTGSRIVGRGWKIRATWMSAWGAPVDLVSAVNPFSGYVLPRHWGKWRSETLVGLEKAGSKSRIQAAVSLRQAERDHQGKVWASCWAMAEIRW